MGSARSIAEAEGWSRRGSAAVDAGDLPGAQDCFLRAARLDPGNANRRFHLAVVLEALANFGAAAVELTEALRLNPKMPEAARRLGLLFHKCILPHDAPLSPIGLRAALGHDTAARDAIAEASIRHLSGSGPLRDALEMGRSKGWPAAARSLCLKATGPLLKNELFLEVLRGSLIADAEIEHLLTALRRVLLLEVQTERLKDRALVGFAIALMQQCWVNEHVWATSVEESRAVADSEIAIAGLLDGDAGLGLKLLLVSLYQPLSRTLGRDVDERSAASIRPQSLGEVIARRVAEESDERRRAARIPQLGTIADETSHKVARQYEANPYPRWTGLGMLVREGDYRRRLGEFFAPDALGFMNGSFDVLIAGCGTGRQAIQAALGYGPQARVLALDLSSASLAYASRMADKLGVRNIDFVRADIQHVDSCQDFLSRFHVIECAGVLHHMADPFQGWRILLKCLRAGGLMVVGLYSASGRANLTALRNDPLYPGAGCDEAQLRSFRQALMARPDGEAGSELKRSADFYSASGFRDLTLHVSEQCLSLPQIELFLDQNGLVFRGFHPSDIFAALRERFPAEVWPGALSRWAELEAANPFMFSRMYQFWCQKL